MDSPAGSTDVRVELEHVDEQQQGLGLEVHVTVQGQQEGVLGSRPLSRVVDPLAQQLVRQEVVHVHHLRNDHARLCERRRRRWKQCSVSRTGSSQDELLSSYFEPSQPQKIIIIRL